MKKYILVSVKKVTIQEAKEMNRKPCKYCYSKWPAALAGV